MAANTPANTLVVWYKNPSSSHPVGNRVKTVFTLYQVVKRSVAESVPDRASAQTKNTAFEAVSALEQYCSAPLLKVGRSVSDRFLK